MNILITGASRGIGKALVMEYANPQDTLFITARNEENLKAVCKKVNEQGCSCYYSVCDSSDYDAVKETIKQFISISGNIDLAILNSGIAIPNSFAEFTIESVRETYNINFFGVLNYMEFLIPLMKHKGGIIAPVSSLADARGYPNSGSYASSKIALSKILEASRIELKPYNIGVTTIRPGFVKTDMTDQNNFKMPFLISVEKAAKIIKQGLTKKKSYIDFPFPTALLSWIIFRLPHRLFEFFMQYGIKKTDV